MKKPVNANVAVNARNEVRKLLSVLILTLTLVACVPPVNPIDPIDPTPVTPDPVEDTVLFDGKWNGTVFFSETDALGNEESQIIFVTVNAINYDEGNISGELQFFTNDGMCDIEGTQVVVTVELNVVCNDGVEDYLAFLFSGEISEGVWSGNYNVLAAAIGIPPGSFSFSYAGGQ